jgi:predicted DNA-binding transcriptional regulator AlpA
MSIRRYDTLGAAAYTGLSKSTLDKLRVKGGGPRYSKPNKRVIYEEPDLDEYMEQAKRASTADPGPSLLRRRRRAA